MGKRFIKPTAADSPAISATKGIAPCRAICPAVSAIATGPEILQALIEPRIICFKPASDRVIIDQVRSAAASTATPKGNGSVPGSKNVPPEIPTNRRFTKSPLALGIATDLAVRRTSNSVPARQTENSISSPSALATACCSWENPSIANPSIRKITSPACNPASIAAERGWTCATKAGNGTGPTTERRAPSRNTV